MLTHADATRYDILAFIQRTWGVRVSTVALHHFCKKFGLDGATRATARALPPTEESAVALAAARADVSPGQPVPLPPPPFSSARPNTPAPSC
jgi:hypothetical protein